MKIEIVNDAGAETLVDGPTRPTVSPAYASGPTGELEYSDDTLIQIAPRLRGAVRAVYSRGNVIATVRFGAVREFATPIAAQTWLAGHILSVRRSHTLKLTDGSSTLELKGGALGPIRYVPRGVEIQLFYTFTFTGVA